MATTPVDCIDIKLERIRAYIQIGNHYYVTTGTDDNAAGDIMSFSISKSRGQSIATFRCQLSVWAEAPIAGDLQTVNNNLGQRIIVYAGVGEKSNTTLPRLFTGYVTNITQDPHWDDSRKYVLNVSGEDEFARMKFEKFSRRFKSGDDSFAVITGGKRREGGRMTKLRRVPPGKRGVETISAGSNSSLEHSPLIRTPDPQGKSPSASTPTSKPESEAAAQTGIRFSQSNAYMSAGDKLFVTVDDEKSGEHIDPNSLKNTEGVKCLCCCNPPPSSFSKGSSSSSSSGTKAEGLAEGEKTYPVSMKYTTQGGKPGIEFTVTGDYPSKVTFIHPLTGQSCTITFNQVPPHDHTDIPRGGPAKGSFDVFQV